jgi:hypothetical protein
MSREEGPARQKGKTAGGQPFGVWVGEKGGVK